MAHPLMATLLQLGRRHRTNPNGTLTSQSQGVNPLRCYGASTKVMGVMPRIAVAGEESFAAERTADSSLRPE